MLRAAWFETEGGSDLLPVDLLRGGVPRNAPASAGTPPGGHLAMLEPVVHGVSRHAQLLVGEFDAEWSPDLVGVSHPCDAAGGERLAFASGQAGGGDLVALAVASAASASVRAASLVSQRTSKVLATKRISWLDVVEGALRAVGLIASALHGQLR